jgi:TonB family protein
LQPLAIDLIMQRERWARKLLDAVLANKLPRGVLNANHLRKILESNDREALWAVEKAFGKVREERNPEREKVVAEMAAYFREHIGDPHRGQTVFRNLCAQCHTIYGEGGQVGPDITANGRASFEQLLSNVFDPSLVIGPAYQVTTVVTKDGRNLTGLIAEDNAQRVVVRMPGEGEETVPRITPSAAQRNLVFQTPPAYPSLAKAARIQGPVQLDVVINKNGTVSHLRAASGHPLLNQAAMDAVGQWRYTPFLLNGEPAEVVTTVTVDFALQ